MGNCRAFSQAGRDLAHWHLNDETVAAHEGVTLVAFSKRQAQQAGPGEIETASI